MTGYSFRSNLPLAVSVVQLAFVQLAFVQQPRFAVSFVTQVRQPALRVCFSRVVCRTNILNQYHLQSLTVARRDLISDERTRHNLLVKLQLATASELKNELTMISIFSRGSFLTEVAQRRDLFAGPHASRARYYEQLRRQQR